ncbi:MAG: hypothetical protein V4492_09150 [Chlamydiota bacterium]
MNRSKRPLTQQAKKSIKKAVHSAQKPQPAKKGKDLSDILTEKELKKKFPKKALSKQKAGQVRLKKATPTAKPAKKRIPSKRTTPGEVPSTSSPASIHPEGARWIKTLTSQARAKRKIDTRQTMKRSK